MILATFVIIYHIVIPVTVIKCRSLCEQDHVSVAYHSSSLVDSKLSINICAVSQSLLV